MHTLVVMGSAPCLEQDMSRLCLLEADYMAVNQAGCVRPEEIKWWATYHPEVFLGQAWHERRARTGGNMDFTAVVHERPVMMARHGVDVVVHTHMEPSGSSALHGVLFGLARGYERIILAGCPLDAPSYVKFHAGWLHHADAVAGRVKSMSGWTKYFLEGLYAH